MAKIERNEKIKQLIRLANDQGYLTYSNINDMLPQNVISAEEIDSIIILLRGMDIEITDEKEVAKRKAALGDARDFRVAYQPLPVRSEPTSPVIQLGDKAIPIGPHEPQQLTLDDCLEIALHNSRDYQDRKDS